MKKRKSQQGIALIAVLWVIAFLTIIASTIAYQSRSSLQMTKNRIDSLKVKQAAEGAILLTIANLINSNGGSGIVPGQAVTQIAVGDVQVAVALHDESGKIDLNTAPADILRALFLEVGLGEDDSANIANAILDWRDVDDLVRVGGAEDAYYLAARVGYESRDEDFRRIEELSLVYGMTPELYSAIFPYITIHTQDYGINLQAASPLVRRAVENAARSEEGSSAIDDEEPLSDEEEFSSLSGGYIYTVQARAKNVNGVQKTYSAVVRLDRGNTFEPFTILKWTQS